MTPEQAALKFGSVENGVWKDERKHCSFMPVPDAISKHLINSMTGLPTKRIYCNKAIQEALWWAFMNVLDRKIEQELKTYDGCLSIRYQRGSKDKLSLHCWGLAIDINAKGNELGQMGTMSAALVGCFKDAGFSHGGDFQRRDPMHFELSALP